ncbi:MAG: LLM class F420-dependent oxidoreductase [Proteobacteria bacterium]|nr:MAG: LLM class F420-dependent oxidoreductase [Pseudomonadota bacterium]
MSRPSVSITVSGVARLFGRDLASLVDFAKRADDAGVDQIAIADHLAIGTRTERYPYGRFPFPNDEPWPEPLVTLAAMAGATQRIRLATAVLIAPLRSALLLAKSLATLDVLSRGRIDLGVGVGWQIEEFTGSGIPFGRRTARMIDALRACRALWQGAPASFDSPTVSFASLWCEPRPVQPGGIPIWFGVAPSERHVAHVVELGQGWMPIGSDLAAIAAGVARLRAAFAAAGRDPASLGVRANVAPAIGDDRRVNLDRTLAEHAPATVAAGATVLAFPLAAYARTPDDLPALLARLGALRI